MLNKGTQLITAFTNYIIVKQVGEGGNGFVYKAKDTNQVNVAIKLFNPSKCQENKLKRFKNEIFFCIQNKHPNIIKVIDYGLYGLENGVHLPFYVMPYYPETGRYLVDIDLDGQTKLEYFSKMLNGVEALHINNCFHRDLKPENVLIDPDKKELVIADLGIAHFIEDDLYISMETKSSEKLANDRYAAPEQRIREERGKVDQRADIYALGLMLNEMFTGELMFGSGCQQISEINPDFALLDDVVKKLTQNKPENRPGSIEEVKQLLLLKQLLNIGKQKMSHLTGEVIPNNQIDDPLVLTPVKVLSRDYQNGMLIFMLNQDLTMKWVDTFHSYKPGSCSVDSLPSRFMFDKNKALIQANESNSRKINNLFLEHLQVVNQKYKECVKEENDAQQQIEKDEISRQIEVENRRQRILEELDTSKE